MTLLLPRNPLKSVSETTIYWYKERGSIYCLRHLDSKIKSFYMQAKDSYQMLSRLEKLSVMSDVDFRYIDALSEGA